MFVCPRYVKTANSVVLDYSVEVRLLSLTLMNFLNSSPTPQVTQLTGSDFILDYGDLGNFSVAGFEMVLKRHISHYLITYYLPSGQIFQYQPQTLESKCFRQVCSSLCPGSVSWFPLTWSPGGWLSSSLCSLSSSTYSTLSPLTLRRLRVSWKAANNI